MTLENDSTLLSAQKSLETCFSEDEHFKNSKIMDQVLTNSEISIKGDQKIEKTTKDRSTLLDNPDKREKHMEKAASISKYYDIQGSASSPRKKFIPVTSLKLNQNNQHEEVSSTLLNNENNNNITDDHTTSALDFGARVPMCLAVTPRVKVITRHSQELHASEASAALDDVYASSLCGTTALPYPIEVALSDRVFDVSVNSIPAPGTNYDSVLPFEEFSPAVLHDTKVNQKVLFVGVSKSCNSLVCEPSQVGSISLHKETNGINIATLHDSQWENSPSNEIEHMNTNTDEFLKHINNTVRISLDKSKNISDVLELLNSTQPIPSQIFSILPANTQDAITNAFAHVLNKITDVQSTADMQKTYFRRLILLPEILLNNVITYSSQEQKVIESRIELLCSAVLQDNWRMITHDEWEKCARAKQIYLPETKDQSAEAKAKRALKFLLQGKQTKALNALNQNGLVTITDNILPSINDLFPQHQLSDETYTKIHKIVNNRKSVMVTSENVLIALNKIADDTSPGLLKIKKEHIISMWHSAKGDIFIKAFTAFINYLVNIPDNQEIFEVISSSELVAVPKPGHSIHTPKIRPIGICDVYSKILINAMVNKYEYVFTHLGLKNGQFGLDVPGGSEIIGHILQSTIDSNPDIAIISCDVENAFNSINRDHILTTAFQYIPELAPFVAKIYSCEKSCVHFSCKNDKGKSSFTSIRTTQGVIQGHPLSSLLFSLATLPILKKINVDKNENKNNDTIAIAFADDTPIIIRPEKILETLGKFQTELSSVSLKLNISKCKILLPTLTAPAIIKQIETSFPRILIINPEQCSQSDYGLQIVGKYIGAPEYVRNELENTTREFKGKLQSIHTLTSNQAKFNLLRDTAGLWMHHLYRLHHPTHIQEAAKTFDSILKTNIEKIIFTKLDYAAWNLTTTPLKYGGLGIPRVSILLQCAFLASTISARLLLSQSGNSSLEKIAKDKYFYQCKLLADFQHKTKTPRLPVEIKQKQHFFANKLEKGAFLRNSRGPFILNKILFQFNKNMVLDNNDFDHLVKLKLRLPDNPCDVPCSCGETPKFLFEHLIRCKESKYHKLGETHSKLNDCLLVILKEAGVTYGPPQHSATLNGKQIESISAILCNNVVKDLALRYYSSHDKRMMIRAPEPHGKYEHNPATFHYAQESSVYIKKMLDTVESKWDNISGNKGFHFPIDLYGNTCSSLNTFLHELNDVHTELKRKKDYTLVKSWKASLAKNQIEIAIDLFKVEVERLRYNARSLPVEDLGATLTSVSKFENPQNPESIDHESINNGILPPVARGTAPEYTASLTLEPKVLNPECSVTHTPECDTSSQESDITSTPEPKVLNPERSVTHTPECDTSSPEPEIPSTPEPKVLNPECSATHTPECDTSPPEPEIPLTPEQKVLNPERSVTHTPEFDPSSPEPDIPSIPEPMISDVIVTTEIVPTVFLQQPLQFKNPAAALKVPDLISHSDTRPMTPTEPALHSAQTPESTIPEVIVTTEIAPPTSLLQQILLIKNPVAVSKVPSPVPRDVICPLVPIESAPQLPLASLLALRHQPSITVNAFKANQHASFHRLQDQLICSSCKQKGCLTSNGESGKQTSKGVQRNQVRCTKCNKKQMFHLLLRKSAGFEPEAEWLDQQYARISIHAKDTRIRSSTIPGIVGHGGRL
jgi:hypothetical protein